MKPTRRAFLEAAGAGIALGPALANAQEGPRKIKVAALASTFFYLSHGYHIIGRFLDNAPKYRATDQTGRECEFEISSLYIEQIDKATDLGRARAAEKNLQLSPTITEALTLGTGKLAVDAVLLIAEHGDYPMNAKLQKLYPRGKYFRECIEVFRNSKKSVPIFLDKHLSYDRFEAQKMVDAAREVKVPFMAGSSLPVTWRLPDVEIPLGRNLKEAVVASRGELDTFGFHALETLQCMVERRSLQGKSQGVKSVICYEGEAVWKALDDGVFSRELLDEALTRNHTANPGDMRRNVKEFSPPRGVPRYPHGPFAIVVEYVDGFRGTALILNGHIDDTSIAVVDDRKNIYSTLMYLPAPPGARFFDPLVMRIKDFFATGNSPYPVERTQLSGGILDAACESRIRGSVRIETPELVSIDYKAPVDSGFIRTPVAR